MGLVCEYFAAPSDAEATTVLDERARPAGAPRRPAGRSLLRRLARRAEEVRPDEPATPSPAYPTVDGGGVEPTVQMGTLEEALTGRPYDDVMAGREDDGVVAHRDGGELLLVRLTATLTAALADADESRLAAAAVPWSATEEFWGQADPEHLAALLGRLAELARDARAKGWPLYCVVSP